MLAVALSFFSFAVLLVATALIFDRAAFSENRVSARHWWLSLIAFWGIYGSLYLFIFKPLLFFQLNNYRLEYEAFLLRDNFVSLDFWKHTFEILIELFRPGYIFVLVALAVMVAIARARSLWASNRFAPARVAFVLGAAILFLSAIGVYPLYRARHLFFTLPFVALLVGWAAQELSNRMLIRPLVGTCLVALLLLPASLFNAYWAYSGRYHFQRTRDLAAFVSSQPDRYVLLWSGFQPAADFYSVPEKLQATNRTVLGRVNSETGVLPTAKETIENYPLVVNKAGGWAATLNLGVLKRTDVYTDWLVSQIPPNEPVLLAMGHYRDGEDVMMRSLAKRNCTSEVVFEDRGVKALRLACPDA
jgi:hypothetical protein